MNIKTTQLLAHEYATRVSNKLAQKGISMDLYTEFYNAYMAGAFRDSGQEDVMMHYLSERSVAVMQPHFSEFRYPAHNPSGFVDMNHLFEHQKMRREKAVREKLAEIFEEDTSAGIPQPKGMIQTWWEALEFDGEPVIKGSEEMIRKRYRELLRKYHPDNKETGLKIKFDAVNFAWTAYLELKNKLDL